MKAIYKISITGIATCFMLGAAFANTSGVASSEYQLTLLKDCQTVTTLQMTPKQIGSYLALQKEEKIMEQISEPIEEIEQQLNHYSTEIEKLSKLAIQETDNSLHINKKYLAEQEQVVDKLNALMATHQRDFDALGKQGRRIGKLANHFEATIKESLSRFDYNQVHIKTPNKSKNYQCNSKITVI